MQLFWNCHRRYGILLVLLIYLRTCNLPKLTHSSLLLLSIRIDSNRLQKHTLFLGSLILDSPGESSKLGMRCTSSPKRASSCSTDSTIEDSTGERIAATFATSSDFTTSPYIPPANPLRSATISISCATGTVYSSILIFIEVLLYPFDIHADLYSKGSAIECEEKFPSPPAPSAMKALEHVDRNLPRPLRFLIVVRHHLLHFRYHLSIMDIYPCMCLYRMTRP